MPSITFQEIGARNLVPKVIVEVDKRGGATQSFVLPKRILLIGGRRSGATVAANTLVRITGDGQGATYHGARSHLAQMCEVARTFDARSRRYEIWSIGVSDAGGGVAATGTITFGGTATSDGQVIYLIGGRRVVVDVSTGDGGSDVATAAAAVSHAHTAVTVAADGADLDITAANDGPGGNDITIVVLQRPPGITATITAMASGATNPDLAATITAIAGQQWTHIVTAFNDDGSMDDLEAELALRAGAYIDLRGHLFAGINLSLADALTYGGARNSEYSTVAHLHLGRSTPWEIATWAAMADAAQDDPARSRNGISGASRGFEGRIDRGIAPMARESMLQDEDFEMLLDAGITPLVVDEQANIEVMRMITTRQTDDDGNASDLQLDITVPRTLAAQILTFKAYMKRLHPNSKKGRDGDELKAAGIATPGLIKKQTMALLDSTWIPLGWVPASARDKFLEELVVEDEPTSTTQFNVRFPTCIMPSLHVLAAQLVLTIG